MRIRIIFFVLLIVFLYTPQMGFGQLATGEWRAHLPYQSAVSITEVGTRMYCATEYSLFWKEKFNDDIQALSKVDGLSDVGINVVKYNADADVVMVAYENANIDLIIGNQIYNVPDIKNKIMTGTKTINNILFINKMAYLSCGFGIVVIDLDKREVKDTYYIGDNGARINVYDMAFDGTSFFAVTEEGIYRADASNEFLANYSNWYRFGESELPNYDKMFTSIVVFANEIYALYENELENANDTIYRYDYQDWSVYQNSIYPDYTKLVSSYGRLLTISSDRMMAYDPQGENTNNIHSYGGYNPRMRDALIDDHDDVWIADEKYGVVQSVYDWSALFIAPNGPYRSTAYDIDIKGEKVWVASGGYNISWTNLYLKTGVYAFENNEWTSFYNDNTPEIHNSIWDITEIEIDPSDHNRVFAGSWGGGGILEFYNNQVVEIYNDSNSSLQTVYAGPYCKIGGMDFDAYNNLWATNPMVENPISVYLNQDKEWVSFPYGNDIAVDFIGDIIATQSGAKWVQLPRGAGLFVFDERGTYDDHTDDYKAKISVRDEDGEIINDIYSIAEDHDGAIWVGTNLGVLVYYSSYSVLQDPSTYAQRIVVEIDGTPQYLLGTETVTAIAIDGANRKWFGTEGGGVYLMSEDATEQILAFNVDNSPLLSNSIKTIAVDDHTGDVYFGTDAGIVSYRGTATGEIASSDSMYVYPNPVRPGYLDDPEHMINIKNVESMGIIKITDISGNIVYETTALGTSAYWDGRDFSGNIVSTGVYLVFCSNDDGTQSNVSKLLFIK